MTNPYMGSSTIERLSVSQFLTDFAPRRIADSALEIIDAPSVAQKIATPAFVAPTFASPAFSSKETPAETAARETRELEATVEIEQIRRDVFEEGRIDGQQTADALFSAERERLLRAHHDEMDALRVSLMDEMASHITSLLQAGLNAFETNISQQLVCVLTPLMNAHFSAQAVADFAQKIARLTVASDDAAMQINGPADLIAALERHRSLLPDGCQLVETDQLELSLALGEQMLETRLQPLLDELKETIR